MGRWIIPNLPLLIAKFMISQRHSMPTSITPIRPVPATALPSTLMSQSGRAKPSPMLAMLIVALVVTLYWWYPNWKAWLLTAPLNPPVAQDGKSGLGGSGGPGGPRTGGGFGGFGGGFGGGGRPQPVSAASVQSMDITLSLNAIGTLTAMNTAIVRSKVDGELKALRFQEGKMVKAGEVLAEVDSRAYDVALAQALGQLNKDTALLHNAQLDAKRYKELWAQDAIAKQQLDTQEALVKQLEGTVQTDQAQVDSAKLNVSYTKVTAPIEGRLGLKSVDLGSLIRSSDPAGIVTITQTQPMAVVFSVPESHVALIQKKLSANATLPVVAYDRDLRQVLAKGRLLTTDNAIDVTTSTLKVKAILDNKEGRLFPNQFTNVQLQLDVLKNTLAVPANAIQRGSIGTFVLLVKEDKSVKTIKVNVLASQDSVQAIEVLQGALQVGDLVVTDGADRLRDGGRVEVVKPTSPGAAYKNDIPRAGPGNGANTGDGGRPSPVAPSKSDAATASPAARAPGNPGAANPNSAAGPGAGAGKAPEALGAAGEGADARPERPRWMDRLPPEVVERVKAMSPEERRAFFQKMRERRQQQQSE